MVSLILTTLAVTK